MSLQTNGLQKKNSMLKSKSLFGLNFFKDAY